MTDTSKFLLKQIATVCGAFILVSTLLFSSISTQAAEFLSESSINTDRVYTNLYAAGNEITIDNAIEKDLVAAGSVITISSSIERNANLAGANITLNPGSRVGANARIAGSKIVIEGTIAEDALLAGDSITLRNATVLGDLVVSSNELIMENTTVAGNGYLSVRTYDTTSVESQIQGNITTSTQQVDVNEEELNEAGSAFAAFVRTFAFIASLVYGAISLIILSLLLRARNRLHIPSISLSKTRGFDFLVGIGGYVVVIAAFLASILIPWLGISTALTTISIMLLAGVFLPIYLGNLMKSMVFKDMAIEAHIAIVWLVLACIEFIVYMLSFAGTAGTVVGFLLDLCINILYLAALGFLLTKIFGMINTFLAKR